MQFTDYYAVLGVQPEASADDIKSAYRKLARKHHPDVDSSPGATQRFARIGEAYEVLSDPTKRSAFDQLRAQGWRDGQEIPEAHAHAGAHAERRGRSGPGDGGGFAAGEEIDPEAFSAFFRSFFGDLGNGDIDLGGGAPRGRGRRRSRAAFTERGDDLRHVVDISLGEAWRGGERELRLRVPTVDAEGQVHETDRTLRVKIPAGVTSGQQIRLRGQGLPGSGPGQEGDLYLEVRIEPHPLFSLDGRDVHLDLPVAPWEAALGARVPVPTLGSTATVTVPRGAQAGTKLRLRGLGLPGTPPGDQIVTLRVVLPPQVSAASERLYRELEQAAPFNPRAELGV